MLAAPPLPPQTPPPARRARGRGSIRAGCAPSHTHAPAAPRSPSAGSRRRSARWAPTGRFQEGSRKGLGKGTPPVREAGASPPHSLSGQGEPQQRPSPSAAAMARAAAAQTGASPTFRIRQPRGGKAGHCAASSEHRVKTREAEAVSAGECGRRRSNAVEYVAPSRASWETGTRIQLLGPRYGEIWGDVERYSASRRIALPGVPGGAGGVAGEHLAVAGGGVVGAAALVVRPASGGDGTRRVRRVTGKQRASGGGREQRASGGGREQRPQTAAGSGREGTEQSRQRESGGGRCGAGRRR